MAKEFRFECKFCNKPIFAPNDAGGRKVRCPHCKNPVVIPMVEFVDDEEVESPKPRTTNAIPQQQRTTNAIPQQQRTTNAIPQQQRTTNAIPQQKRPATVAIPQQGGIPKSPDPGKRPIQSRYRWNFLYRILNWIIFAALCYGGYQGYLYYKKQSNKSISQLFQEVEDGKVWNDTIIKANITGEDFGVLKDYANSPEEDMRKLVANCLEELGKREEPIAATTGFEILKKYLISDPANAVKVAAAEALGTIRKIETIDLLVDRIEKDRDPDVDGAIGRALRKLTGESGKSVNKDYWLQWWKMHRAGFQFSKD